MITYKYEHHEADWHKVRELVFMEEQGFQNEFDRIDEYAHHVTIYVGGELAGCGRCFPSDDRDVYVAGRIAVLKPFRKQALGSHILLELERIALKQGAKSMVLDAQCRAIDFYVKVGYQVNGELHMDEHVPHKQMKKELMNC